MGPYGYHYIPGAVELKELYQRVVHRNLIAVVIIVAMCESMYDRTVYRCSKVRLACIFSDAVLPSIFFLTYFHLSPVRVVGGCQRPSSIRLLHLTLS